MVTSAVHQLICQSTEHGHRVEKPTRFLKTK